MCIEYLWNPCSNSAESWSSTLLCNAINPFMFYLPTNCNLKPTWEKITSYIFLYPHVSDAQ